MEANAYNCAGCGCAINLHRNGTCTRCGARDCPDPAAPEPHRKQPGIPAQIKRLRQDLSEIRVRVSALESAQVPDLSQRIADLERTVTDLTEKIGD